MLARDRRASYGFPDAADPTPTRKVCRRTRAAPLLQRTYGADKARHGSLGGRRIGRPVEQERAMGLLDWGAVGRLRGWLVEEAEKSVALVCGDGIAAGERGGLSGKY